MSFLDEWQNKVKDQIKRIAEKPKQFIKNKTGPLLYCAVAAIAFQDAAQALAGGRGKAGFIRTAKDRNQAEQIIKALDENGIMYEYYLYPEEGHGFKQAENIADFYQKTDQFLRQFLKNR